MPEDSPIQAGLAASREWKLSYQGRRCGPAFMRDFAAACRAMLPLVEFTTKALGLKF